MNWQLFFLLLISLVSAAALALNTWFGRSAGWLNRGLRVLVAVLSFLAFGDLVGQFPSGQDARLLLGSTLALGIGCLGGAALLLLLSSRYTLRASWVLLVVALVASGWWSQRYYGALADFESEVPPMPEMGTIAPSRIVSYTDAGQVVTLYEEDKPNPKSCQKTALEHPAFAGRLIVAGPDSAGYNCHGWAFTGGAFGVSGEHVDLILKDNWYAPVESPRPDDLVIWRDSQGVPIHTGVVKATGHEFVLIESKWGKSGRYLHVPQDQGYSKEFTYYRSPRRGHVLYIAAPYESSPIPSSPGVLASRSAGHEPPPSEALDPRVLGAE